MIVFVQFCFKFSFYVFSLDQLLYDTTIVSALFHDIYPQGKLASYLNEEINFDNKTIVGNAMIFVMIGMAFYIFYLTSASVI